MKKPIYIFGAGGLGREINAMLRQSSIWEVAGFYDDNKGIEEIIDGIQCLGGMDELRMNTSNRNVVLGVGDPLTKLKMLDRLQGLQHLTFPVLIHPSATLLDPDRMVLGPGCIIAAGSILTTGISIGSHTLINLRVTVGHDTRIGDCCSIMPGVNIAGDVYIGNGVLVGSGANVLNRVKVGSNAKIGAGAAVIHNVRDEATVVGIPAREKRPT